MVTSNELKKLVLVRLEAMPDNMKIHMGSFGEIKKSDLIKHVREEDNLGKLIVETQIEYLKSMKGI